MSYISQSLIEQTSAGVSPTTASVISALHITIRDLLLGYDTFLQGSYANDTAISDINDVDIVALSNTPQFDIRSANNFFPDVQRKIEVNANYRGRVSIGRKCLTLTLQTKKADIVPAVKRFFANSNNVSGEPIYIASGIPNYPKTHIRNGQAKNYETTQRYKPMVRMFKHFCNNWHLNSIAPSFYVECLIYSYSTESFGTDLPSSMYSILNHMINGQFDYDFKSVAGDKIIIAYGEWSIADFTEFRNIISANIHLLRNALNSTDTNTANYYYRQFFHL